MQLKNAQQYNPGAAAYAGDAAARQLEIPHQLEIMDTHFKGVTQGLDTLESRLCPKVMRDQPPSTSQGQLVTPTPAAVRNTNIGGHLGEYNVLLAIINDRIQSMVQRLEV